ncbi:hypothetical protein SH668x_003362 [Planctomicrobium sp. SH668]|uniref:hypothetical protein n=1 Tax=Planctomicrobium sp. SH668 TaxID=3448126 RepID=UPI003F5C8493
MHPFGIVARISEEADEEVVYWDEARPALLPVWTDGQLVVMPWGGWRRVELLRDGEWGGREAVIPATFAFDNGFWYAASAIRCSILERTAYPISQPATHYYEVMTRQKRMPMFVGDQI